MSTTTNAFVWLPVPEGDRLCLDGWPIEIRRGAEGMALFVDGRQDIRWAHGHHLVNLKECGEARAREMAEFAGLDPASGGIKGPS